MQNATEIIHQYTDLIHHCLHRTFVTSYHNNYDDFFQIAQIALLKAADRSDRDPLSQDIATRRAFVSYARRTIIWAIRDEQRKVKRYSDHEDLADDFTYNGVLLDDYSALELVWLDTLAQIMTPRDWDILAVLLDEELTHNDRAARLGVGRFTYYRWRDKFREKVRKVIETCNNK